MPLKNKTSLFSSLVLQTSYVSNSENAQNMSAEDVMDKDTFYSVLADLDIQLCLFEPEWVWGIGHQKFTLSASWSM